MYSCLKIAGVFRLWQADDQFLHNFKKYNKFKLENNKTSAVIETHKSFYNNPEEKRTALIRWLKVDSSRGMTSELGVERWVNTYHVEVFRKGVDLLMVFPYGFADHKEKKLILK